jgi:glucose-1-phosphate thymidylyltransferase
MKGVILSGGSGTRLRPFTHTGPKQLVPVANKPVLEYAIDDLKAAGITEIGIILGHKGREDIQNRLGDGSEYGVDITYIVQGNPLGLAHAVGCARDFVGNDDFVVYLGDNLLKDGITELVDSFRSGDYGAGIALQQVDDPGRFGVADVNEAGNVQKLIEKPDDPPSDLALIGIYVFSSDVFEVIERLEPSWRGELEITDAIQLLMDDGHEIDSHVVEGWWKDTGKPEDILEANRLVLGGIDRQIDGIVKEGAEVSGPVELAESAVVESGAVVRGPVSLAADVIVEAGSYIGPYTSIGETTTVSGTHIENSVIIGESEITTDRKLIDSLIGRASTIGSSQGLLPNGERLVIGENSDVRL